MKTLIILALLGLATLPMTGLAADRAINCDGCSASQMSASAGRAVQRGTVYVFDGRKGRVRKYAVYSEVIDLQPRTSWRQVMELPVEAEITQNWYDFIHLRDELHGDGDLVLPPGFPVRSVGGALNDPNWSSTHIEDYLFELGTARQSELVLSTLITHLVRANIPATDLSGLLTTLVITVVFPDGSQMDYAIHYNQNVLKGEAKMELTADGNARMPDGSPAPTSGGSFAGLTIHDHNGSLQEWILWARSLGLIVSGPGNGTTMTCKVVGNEIHCTVVKRP